MTKPAAPREVSTRASLPRTYLLELIVNQTAPTAARFRHRTAEVDAVQWTGSNADQLIAFAPDRFATAAPEDRIDPEDDALVLIEESHWVAIRPGCWVLKYPDHFDVESDADFRAVWKPAAVSAVVSPPTNRAELRDRIAAAMREHYLCTNRDEADADRNLPCRCGDWREPGAEVDDENDWDSHLADVALAVLPEQADRAAVARVRALHQQYTFGDGTTDYCAHCNQIRGGWVPWPCPTVRALDVELAVEAHDTGTQQPARCPHGCDVTRCPCLACEAADSEAEEAAAYSRALSTPPSAEAGAYIRDRLAQRAAEPAPVAQQPAAADGEETLCRCGHGKNRHAPDVYGNGTCADCPEDGERSWRHPFTPRP